MGLSSFPNIFTEFMQFLIWAMNQDRPDLYYKQVDADLINLENFINEADVTKRRSTPTSAGISLVDIMLKRKPGNSFLTLKRF